MPGTVKGSYRFSPAGITATLTLVQLRQLIVPTLCSLCTYVNLNPGNGVALRNDKGSLKYESVSGLQKERFTINVHGLCYKASINFCYSFDIYPTNNDLSMT